MSDLSIEQCGSTRCTPSWISNIWIEEPCLKLYIVSSGSGRYAIPADAGTIRVTAGLEKVAACVRNLNRAP